MEKKHLEELTAFLRECRSNESNFETLHDKLEAETANKDLDEDYRLNLDAAKAKAEAYRQAKETGGTAWPEFEKFVSDFERAVTEALKSAA